MGMYTELVLKCSLYEDIPETVKTILNNLFNDTEDVFEGPDAREVALLEWRSILYNGKIVKSYIEGEV